MIVRYLLFVLLSFSAFSGHAQLIDRGNGLVYDSEQDITWLTDAGRARSEIGTEINWVSAVQWANDLLFAGYSNWRLPDMDVNGDGVIVDCRFSSTSAADCLDNEYDYLFSYHHISVDTPGLFENIGTLHYWSGTENPVFPDLAYLLNFETGFRGTTSKITTNRNAWAVADGDIAAVPLPSAAWLFFSAVTGVFFTAKRRPHPC